MNKIEQIASEIAASEGCKLYDIEFVGTGRGRTLRVFIDKDNQGIGIDDCVSVTKALNQRLDADEEMIPGGSYQLEVSSPGVDRHLRKDWHFAQAVGQKVYLQLSKPIGELGISDKRWEKCKKTEAFIKSTQKDIISVEVEGGILVDIPLSIIEKAKVVFEIEKGTKK